MVEYYCIRCGRKCTKNPQVLEGKIYGSHCIKKVITKAQPQQFKEEKSW